jgi:hypothetical protein
MLSGCRRHRDRLGPRAVLLDAALVRRLLDRELRVGLGDVGLAARVVVVALVELVLREVVVRLGHRELDGRAALGAAVARGRDQAGGRGGLGTDLGAGAARAGDRQHGAQRDGDAGHGASLAGAVRRRSQWTLAGARVCRARADV